MTKLLLTGGAGYIGIHTAVQLINSGIDVVIVDNFCNSSRRSVERAEEIAGATIPLYEADVRDVDSLDRIFAEHSIDGVIHFAGLKAVGESVGKPLEYYNNNLSGTFALLKSMQKAAIKKLVFSSSATVYGTPAELPLRETSQTGIGITNPYGQTKYMIEQILHDVAHANPEYEITILRYFNPIGAHSSGRIGEDPNGPPNNLAPYIAQTAVGKREFVGIFGNDYETPDGTGIRDYIHVVDLADGHVAAFEHSRPGAHVYNLGTGRGTSVLELIAAFSRAAEREIPYKILPRRPGDIATCYASSQKAADELDWHAKLTIDDACRDAWRWQSQNPDGYQTS